MLRRLGLLLVVLAEFAVLLVVVPADGFATAGPAPEVGSRPADRISPSVRPAPRPSSPVALDVVALGDSVTAGSNCQCTAFPRLYANGLAAASGAAVHLVNDGEAGETSDDLLGELGSSRREEQDLAEADIVLITVGANDFATLHDTIGTRRCGAGGSLAACTRPGLGKLAGNLATIISRVSQLRAHRPTVILVTGYWNVFEDGDVAGRVLSRVGQDASDQLTRLVNSALARAAREAGVTYVDLYAPFKGADGQRDPTALLADDGDHPNAAGHRLIARRLLAAGLQPCCAVHH